MLWCKLDSAHGALSINEHRAFNPFGGARGGLARIGTVEPDAVRLSGGDLLPDFDGAIKGGGGEDGAELGVGPADFGDGCIMRLERIERDGLEPMFGGRACTRRMALPSSRVQETRNHRFRLISIL